MAKGAKRAKNFDRVIEGRTPDPEVPGWDVLHLECGHTSHAPTVSRDFTKTHCGVCLLNHEEHERAIKQLQAKIAAAAGAEGKPDATA